MLRVSAVSFMLTRWGFESVDLLHYFDYAKGTPALVTWVAHNFFYFAFNAGLWLLFRGLAALLFARTSSAPLEAAKDHAGEAPEGAAADLAGGSSSAPANAADGAGALPPPTPPPGAGDKAKAE